jgi:RHS repeat-associated protein
MGVRAEVYEMDLADNLLSQPGLSGVSLNDGNRLKTANGYRFAYNDRNHIAVRETATGMVHYHYDSRDQLVRVEFPAGKWHAEYDALGRRSSKTFAGRRIEFYWNADQLIAEIDPDGRLRIYVYADHLALTPLMFVDYDSVKSAPEAGLRFFIVSDQVGAPCEIYDEQGAEVWRARISPFGQAEVAPDAKIVFNLRFPGHYADDELGLHYNRFRHYDPLLGRYLQSDPWGISGGFNLYAYRLNPLDQVDVRGLGEENKKKGKPCPDEEGTNKPAITGDDAPITKNGYDYHLDDKGRVIEFGGELTLNKEQGRNTKSAIGSRWG